MRFRIRQTRLVTSMATTASAISLLAFWSAQAQIYTWDQQALGQEFQHCVNLNPQYWPSNSIWSQSLQMDAACGGTSNVVYQPSNWSPVPPPGVYPNGPGVDIILGAPADTVLDVPVTVNSLTILTNGALSITSAGGLTANNIDLQGDGAIGNIPAGGGNDYVNITAGGTLTKSGGTGTFYFGDPTVSGVALYGNDCTLAVKSGTLALPYGGRGSLYNGTFAVSNNAALIIAPDANGRRLISGKLSGTGRGTVLFNNGSIWAQSYDLNAITHSGIILDFPGNMFQWSGGNIQSGAGVTNINVVNVTSNAASVYSITFFNYGTLNLTDRSALGLVGGELDNETGGTINVQGDADITGGGLLFFNYGLLKKSAGTGTATIVPRLNNQGGTLEVDSGTLALNTAGSAGYFSNTTFIVQPGATLSLSSVAIYSTQIEGLLKGSGGGTVLVSAGEVHSIHGGMLDFPGSMFQWIGGVLGGSGTFLTNVGTVNISGPVTMPGFEFANNGMIIQAGAGAISGIVAIFNNNPGGVYQFQNDLGNSVSAFNNAGLLEKTAGTGTSAITGTFHNSGAIVAATGTLLFTTNFFQDAGTLQITPAIRFGTNQPFNLRGGTVTGAGALGGNGVSSSVVATGGVLAPSGTLSVPGGGGISLLSGSSFQTALAGPNQFGQLIVSNSANLGGTLHVTLVNGYAPDIGTKFQILSCAKRIGTFATTNVPSGIAVSYSTNGVFLTVTGTVPVQMNNPQRSGSSFAFSFDTLNQRSYTIEHNTDLGTTNWILDTNLIGSGLPYQFITPAASVPQDFFRVRER